MDTEFAKIVTEVEGRSFILIEGNLIGLDIQDMAANNEWVERIVRGLRSRQGGAKSVTPPLSGNQAGLDVELERRCPPFGSKEWNEAFACIQGVVTSSEERR